jgi:glycosyltransferase involved in cell wall biosynthesis
MTITPERNATVSAAERKMEAGRTTNGDPINVGCPLEPAAPPKSQSVSLSVIIATYNSARYSHFRRCIESVRLQHFDGALEVIVVDGGSTDETLTVAREFGARVVHNPRRTELGFGAGKDIGLKASKGEYVSFVDADNILIGKDYFQDMLWPMTQDETVAMSVPGVYVPEVRDWTSVGRYFCLIERDEWRSKASHGVSHGKWVRFATQTITVSNAAVIRKRVLDDLGGWDYDTEVGNRLASSGNWAFAYVPSAMRLHLEVRNYRDVARKFARRIRNHFSHYDEKPVVQGRLESGVSQAGSLIDSELVTPLKTMLKDRDLTYLHAVPVFCIKTALVTSGLARFKLQRRNLIAQ